MFVTEDDPGKYNDLCTHVRETTLAAGAIVLVVGGNKGTGFSVQGDLYFLLTIPDILRKVADDIEADARKLVPVKDNLI